MFSYGSTKTQDIAVTEKQTPDPQEPDRSDPFPLSAMSRTGHASPDLQPLRVLQGQRGGLHRRGDIKRGEHRNG